MWTSLTELTPYWGWWGGRGCCGGSGGFEQRGGEISSIKSEVEALRIFDCFDDGTAGGKVFRLSKPGIYVTPIRQYTEKGRVHPPVKVVTGLSRRFDCLVVKWGENRGFGAEAGSVSELHNWGSCCCCCWTLVWEREESSETGKSPRQLINLCPINLI